MITFSLIVIALFFVRQLYTMLHADLGYQTKNIISAQFLSHETMNKAYASDEEWQKAHDLEQHKEQIIKQKMDGCPSCKLHKKKGCLSFFMKPWSFDETVERRQPCTFAPLW